MPHFHMVFLDKPNSLELRLATREAHLEYLKSFGAQIKLAGPLIADSKPYGSVIIIECDDVSGAQDYATNDPYAKADLFGDVKISQYNPLLGAWVS